MVIATVVIAGATVANIVLFCVFQHQQKKIVRLDAAMKYLGNLSDRSEKLRQSFDKLEETWGSTNKIPRDDLRHVVDIFFQQTRALENIFEELKMKWLLNKLQKSVDDSACDMNL